MVLEKHEVDQIATKFSAPYAPSRAVSVPTTARYSFEFVLTHQLDIFVLQSIPLLYFKHFSTTLFLIFSTISWTDMEGTLLKTNTESLKILV